MQSIMYWSILQVINLALIFHRLGMLIGQKPNENIVGVRAHWRKQRIITASNCLLRIFITFYIECGMSSVDLMHILSHWSHLRFTAQATQYRMHRIEINKKKRLSLFQALKLFWKYEELVMINTQRIQLPPQTTSSYLSKANFHN